MASSPMPFAATLLPTTKILDLSAVYVPTTNNAQPDTIPPSTSFPITHPTNPFEQNAISESTGASETDSLSNDTIYVDVELMPKYSGGIDSLMSYLRRNINYPKWEFEQNIQGTVYVTFVVSSSGKITESQIIKTVPESKNFDTEVLRVISSMPDWVPGEHEGKKVDVSFKLPITFRR
jgi:TonB family protein